MGGEPSRRRSVAVAVGIFLVLVLAWRACASGDASSPASTSTSLAAAPSASVPDAADAGEDAGDEAAADALPDTKDAPEEAFPAPGSCEVLEAQSRAAEAKALAARPDCKKHAGDPIAPAMTRCSEDDAGVVVGLRVDRVVFSEPGREPECELNAQISLVRAARGAQVTLVLGSDNEHLETDAGRVEVNFERLNGWHWDIFGEPVFFDYDGDGEREVIVSGIPARGGADEWQGHEWHHAWTFRAGAWKPYPPVRDIAIDEVVDVDEDGRPDIRTRGPYDWIRSISPMAGSEERAIAPMLVAHSRPNGTFSLTDDVARAATAEECRKAPPLDFDAEADDRQYPLGELESIVCARLAGTSAADIKATLKPPCKTFETSLERIGPGHCPDTIRQILGVPPPLRLPEPPALHDP